MAGDSSRLFTPFVKHPFNFCTRLLDSPSSLQTIGRHLYVPQNVITSQPRRSRHTFANLATPQVSTADSSAPGGTYTPNGTSSMNLMTSTVNALFSYQVQQLSVQKVHVRDTSENKIEAGGLLNRFLTRYSMLHSAIVYVFISLFLTTTVLKKQRLLIGCAPICPETETTCSRFSVSLRAKPEK